ncbi:MAG: TerC family protein [Acidobacteria bacterium]|nr:TerC family protein [Acidobacteriota bacterium]
MLDALLLAAPWWAWAGFHILIFLMLALDLGIFNRRAHAPSVREAGAWSVVWILLALAFNAAVWRWMGPPKGLEWLTGYLLEKSLSVDNLFVFLLIFSSFQVELRHQHRVLYWGVLGALILRAAMILAGTALLNRFAWMTWVFGGFLVWTGLRMLFVKEADGKDPSEGLVARLFRRVVPYDPEGGHLHFVVTRDGRRLATPLLLVLLIVEVSDLVFAVDSIPAVLAVTRDPFVVYTSNVFAILGLRSLYFLLAKMADRFHRLSFGLALILAYVGVKMCIAEWFKIPTLLSLAVICLVLAGSMAASLLWPSRDGDS